MGSSMQTLSQHPSLSGQSWMICMQGYQGPALIATTSTDNAASVTVCWGAILSVCAAAQVIFGGQPDRGIQSEPCLCRASHSV